MTRPAINSGRLTWSGEHWICFLRPEGAGDDGQDSALVSLYRTQWSPAGEGLTAFVHIPAGTDHPEVSGIYHDNEELAGFLYELYVQNGRSAIRDVLRPELHRAELTRAGDVRRDPAWVIRPESGPVVRASWSQLQPALFTETPAPALRDDADLFAVLVFADGGRVEVDDVAVDGAPYPRDIWARSIGGTRSSCVFALGETFVPLS